MCDNSFINLVTVFCLFVCFVCLGFCGVAKNCIILFSLLDASDSQMTDAMVATERAIMSRIYKLALYPNGDGDVARDQ